MLCGQFYTYLFWFSLLNTGFFTHVPFIIFVDNDNNDDNVIIEHSLAIAKYKLNKILHNFYLTIVRT